MVSVKVCVRVFGTGSHNEWDRMDNPLSVSNSLNVSIFVEGETTVATYSIGYIGNNGVIEDAEHRAQTTMLTYKHA